MEVGENTEINFNSRYIYLASFVKINEGDIVYVLFKNDCVELRTKEQYDSLILKLDRLIDKTTDLSKKMQYTNLRSSIRMNSKKFDVYQKKRIFFGPDFVRRYSISDSIIVEQGSDCLKLWNPSIFRIKQDDSAVKRGRR